MKKNLLPVLALMLCANLYGQNFQIGHTTLTFTDASRNNRAIATEIYYPADQAGNNVPFTNANTDRFPVLSFGHGFVMGWDAYQNIWEAVVPQGFITAFPKTEGSLSPSHLEFGKDISFVIASVTALGQNNASLFYNRVDTMNCVMGHSMGGGAAFLAAQFDPAVKSLATLAPAETSPSAIQAAAGLPIPALVFSGGNDCVTPPPAHQVPMYNALQSSCKTYISINGGSHCQMADNNLLCNFGEASCTPAPAISRAEQHQRINLYLIPWLKYTLKGDCSAGALFDSSIETDTSIVFEKTCLLCEASGISNDIQDVGMYVFPNPFTDHFFVQCKQATNSKVDIDLRLPDGRKVFSQSFSNVQSNEPLEIHVKNGLPPGIYLLLVVVEGRPSIQQLIRH